MPSYSSNLETPRQLSLVVYELLDQIGLSEEMRKLNSDAAYTYELSNNIGCSNLSKYFIFGSTIEGTQTPGMKSDFDMAFVNQAIEVYTDYSVSGGRSGLIAVQDKNTPPGYVKLQMINDYKPLQETPEQYALISDEINRSLLDGPFELLPDDKGRMLVTIHQAYIPPIPNVTKHGVAFKQDKRGDLPDFDYVFALHSKMLPDCVSDSLIRKQISDFFTPSVVEACKSFGCLFVRKEHQQSIDSHLLWRISPSHQERFLMSNFNSVQHKCYVLLKLIKKDIINSALGSEVLTSYHCKTAMLHLVDKAPSQFWRPDNLLFCLITALHYLLLWSMDSNCPNFFIPEENMFGWRISRHLLKRLSDELFRLMSLDFVSLLRSIKTDNFNHNLKFSMTDNLRFLVSSYQYTGMAKGIINSRTLQIIMYKKNSLLLKCYSHCTTDLIENLFNELSILMHTDRLDIRIPVNNTRRFKSLLTPYIEIYLMSNVVALSVKRGDTNKMTWGYLTSVRWSEISLSSDPFTSRLKQASHMSALGYHRASLNVLSTIDNNDILNGCACNKYNLSQQLLIWEDSGRLRTASATVYVLLRRLWAPCVLFLPTEQVIVPSAISYEMSIPAAPEVMDSWYDHWAIVDGKFLLHFLLYLNRKNLGLSYEADIQAMEEYLKNETHAVHRDTDLNLLGWVYKEEGKLDIALKCFKKSLHFRSKQKAAIWHILCVISNKIHI